MGFDFSLQKVLDYRKLEEREKRNVLAVSIQAEQAQRKQLEALKNDLTGQLTGNYSGKLDLEILKQQFAYCQKLSLDISKQKEVLEAELQQVEQRRRELLEARKETMILEKTKERELQQHIQEEKKVEQIELDEVATNLFLRSNN